jgi:hypothetical protein
MRTVLDFKFAQYDQVRGEAGDWIKMRGLEIWSNLACVQSQTPKGSRQYAG